MPWPERLLALTRYVCGIGMLLLACLILYNLALAPVPPVFAWIHLTRVIAGLALGLCGSWLLDGRRR